MERYTQTEGMRSTADRFAAMPPNRQEAVLFEHAANMRRYARSVEDGREQLESTAQMFNPLYHYDSFTEEHEGAPGKLLGVFGAVVGPLVVGPSAAVTEGIPGLYNIARGRIGELREKIRMRKHV